MAGYALEPPVTCRYYAGGVNDVYLVETGEGRRVLRVTPTGWRSHSDVDYEVDALLHLGRNGISIAEPLPARDGSFVREVQAPEGVRYAVLFIFAPGRVHGELDASFCRRFGQAVGQIHAATDDLHTPHTRFALDLDHLVDQPLAAIRPLLDKRPDDWRFLHELGQRLRTRIEQLAARGLDRGFCHGDLQAENAHLDGERLTFFDFDCGGPGWHAYDIAVFRWTLNSYGRRVSPDHEPRWQDFLAGYGEHHQLGRADIEAVPVFVAMRHIWMIGLHAAFAPQSGYARYETDYFPNVLQFLRDWEAMYIR